MGEEGKIRGVVTESKSGRRAIIADRVIDCTWDADIAHMAGAEYRKTAKSEMMGMTTVFNASGVDKEDFVKYTESNPATYRDWSRTWDQETTGKEDDLKSPYLDREFEEARARGVIPPETSNIGSYNLTSEDVRNCAKFEDSIGIFPEFIDGYNILILPTTGRYFQVPYGIMVPPSVDNLLVAGRCVAGDKTSHCAMRNMMACTVTGQGAGTAAAVSIKEGVSTLEVDVKDVQEELVKQGARIH